MSATLLERREDSVTLQVHIPLSRSLLDTERAIQQALNAAGLLATTEALRQFDTDGSPLRIGQARYTSKGQEPKGYQTPYGEAVVARHVYQTAQGGATFCPLERDARIILASTPRFAQLVSHKYAEMPGARVVADLQANHGRPTSLNVVQRLADAVGGVVCLPTKKCSAVPTKKCSALGMVYVAVDTLTTTGLLSRTGFLPSAPSVRHRLALTLPRLAQPVTLPRGLQQVTAVCQSI